jgi:transcriptional regulator with XRE-family HTH domain
MPIDNFMTDKAVLSELGKRLAQHRIDQNITQENLAKEAGISKRTLERLEAGQPSQLMTFVRVLRALNMINLLEAAIPEAVTHPVDLLKIGKDRQRASSKRKESPEEPWQWGDE